MSQEQIRLKNSKTKSKPKSSSNKPQEIKSQKPAQEPKEALQEIKAQEPDTTTQAQPESQAVDSLGEYSTETPPTHFDSLISDQAITVSGGEGYSERQLTKDEFTLALCGGLQGAGHFTGFKTLQAVDAKEQRNVDGCHAIYDTINEIPMLSFLLSPGGKWFGRVMAIGAFTIPLAVGVKHEIAARKVTEPKGDDEDAAQAVK